jgi:hypothetical protein
MVEYYALIHENVKMRPVETIPGMGGMRIKNDGQGECHYDIRTFINVTMYPQCNNVILKT